MTYIPHTDADRREMLEAIGVESIEDLFRDIPPDLRIERLDLPDGLSELEVRRHLTTLAEKNANLDEYACFLGAGAYDHFVPSVVRALTSRGEFSTAYTPYQPEVSQGSLQAAFEYQTLICELTGMPVANASMYDGASALAEGVLLAEAAHRKADEILIARTVHPEYRSTVKTYMRGRSKPPSEVPYDPDVGTTRLDVLEAMVSDRTAAVVVQQPNFFGAIEPVREIAEIAKRVGAYLVTAANPISRGLLTPPGEYGADVVVGEGQSLGNAISYGGPYLGFFAVTEALMRRMPGRVVGETVDVDGRRATVMTLRAREQDIRREKATSNICTNQALNALAACVYLCALGKKGLRQLAELNLQKAHYAQVQINDLEGFRARFPAPFFNEFVIECPLDVEEINRSLVPRRILGGLPLVDRYSELEDCSLVAVTEMRTKDEIDSFVEGLKAAADRSGLLESKRSYHTDAAEAVPTT